MTELYQKLLGKASKGEAANVFAAEESLGKEDAERALAQKREKAREFSQYPVLSEYPLVSIKEKIREALIEAYGEDFILAIPPAEGCGQIGQTDASAYLVSVSPQRLDTIVVCSRDASTATLRTLRAFLDAVEWRTP